jgi:AcrR family transcriptional regulator
LPKSVTTDAADKPAGPVLGLRERGKLRRRKRIKEAARAVFVERGYEAATTREIAERAEVSLGTLFAYAPTKSELLLMIVNDDHAEMGGDRLPAHGPDTALMDLMMAFGRQEYAYWGQYPELARQARREIAVVLLGRQAGPEAVRFAGRKPQLLAEMAAFVKGKQKAGSVGTDAAPELIADMWWALYNQSLHNWLNQARPDLRKGMLEMQRLMALAMHGLDAAPAEFGKEVAGLTRAAAAPTADSDAEPSKARTAAKASRRPAKAAAR